MKDELISWETAKLAKEKGCLINDEKCFNFYNTSKVLIENANVPEKLYPNEYEAISQSLLQRWLREVHKTHLHICYFPETKKWNVDIYKYEEDNGLMNNPLEFQNNDTYEQALEKGLKEGLKLIK